MEEKVTTTISKVYTTEDFKMTLSVVNGELNYIRFYNRTTRGKDVHMMSLNFNRPDEMTSPLVKLENIMSMLDKAHDYITTLRS